jgi:hypothetical protein
MTHYQLTLANHTFSFRPQVLLLWAAACIGGMLLMFAYVGALKEAVQRGEALRQTQRAGYGLAAAAEGGSTQRSNSGVRKLVALDR